MSKKQEPNKPSKAPLDYEAYKKQVIAGLMAGAPLTGENGLLKPLIADFVEGALQAEMDEHLKEEKAQGITNKRNGKQSKEIRSESGTARIEYSRDRNGTFEPVTVKKRGHQLLTGFDNQILELYAMSNSLADIKMHLEKMYGAEMSEGRISSVINATWDRVNEWHTRLLPACMVVLFIDAVHINIRRDGAMKKVALYVAYGITVEGKREIIALIPGQGAESATEWGRCLQQLKNRGLVDVLHICSDGLAGLREVVSDVYPEASIQRCIVHKMRNCMRLLDEKDSKLVVRQLKEVYNAVNEAEAKRKLEDFDSYWEDKYKAVSNLWRKDWDDLMGCMSLSPALKKLTYTTNAIENLNREIRRVTKTKSGWVSDRALLIQLFLSLERKKGSWNKVVRAWASISRELARTHGERFIKHLS